MLMLKCKLLKQTGLKNDRTPDEVLFSFKRCIVHFAVDDNEVRMCTELKGNKSSLPKEFSEYDSSRFHYAVVAGLREDYNEATYRDRRNKATQQNILTLHYDNLYDKACELETAQSF